MNSRDSILFWSIPAGTWFRTHLRISIFFPIVFAVLWYKFGLKLGGVFFGVLSNIQNSRWSIRDALGY